MEGLAGKHLIISQMCRVTGSELSGFVSAFGKHPGMIVYDLWQDANSVLRCLLCPHGHRALECGRPGRHVPRSSGRERGR